MEGKISIGFNYIYTFSFTQKDVELFAKASGDLNPIHLDEEYAKQTIFKRTIVHGLLGGSVFSKVFGTIFPGDGTIYLKQDLSFFYPMHTETKYTATFKVISIDASKNRAIVETNIIDDQNNFIIKGEALIKHPTIC